MKLYDFALAPNPRRVRVFAAEKGIALDTVQVNVRAGEQFEESFRAINPNCTVPVLVLDDGTALTDSFAICRYLEEIQPDPPLLGRDPREKALIELWLRKVELEGYQAVGEVLRNSAERFVGRAVPGPVGYSQIPALAERGRKRLAKFFEMLNSRLGESDYLAGPDYTAADLAALIAVDFAQKAVQEEVPEGLTALKAWHDKVSARPSATA